MTNSIITLAVYRLKPNASEQQLLEHLRTHHNVLLEEGLIIPKPSSYWKASENIFIEPANWVSSAASKSAHSNPKVLEVWGALEGVADFLSLGDLPQSSAPFPSFEAFSAPVAKPAQFEDTMIGAKDIRGLVQFYREFLGLKTEITQDSFVTLRDPTSGQALCVTNGECLETVGMGIRVEELSAALDGITKAGGRILKTWDWPTMDGANCADPEGHEFIIWREKTPT